MSTSKNIIFEIKIRNAKYLYFIYVIYVYIYVLSFICFKKYERKDNEYFNFILSADFLVKRIDYCMCVCACVR